MARFSAGGDEDENQERSNDRRSPKKPRISNTGSNTPEKPNAATKASTSTAQPPMLTDLTPEKPLPWNLFRRSRVGCYETEEESEGESEHEPDTSSSSEPEEESDVDETNHDDEVQPAEARVDSVPNGNGSCPDSEEATEHVPVIMTDLRVLDCDICFEPLSSPVFQVPSISSVFSLFLVHLQDNKLSRDSKFLMCIHTHLSFQFAFFFCFSVNCGICEDLVGV